MESSTVQPFKATIWGFVLELMARGEGLWGKVWFDGGFDVVAQLCMIAFVVGILTGERGDWICVLELLVGEMLSLKLIEDEIGEDDLGGTIVDEAMLWSLFKWTPAPLRSEKLRLHSVHNAEGIKSMPGWMFWKCLLKLGHDLIVFSQRQQ